MDDKPDENGVIDITKTIPKSREGQVAKGLEEIRQEAAEALNVSPNTTLEQSGNLAKFRKFQEYLESYTKVISQENETSDTLALSGILDVMRLHSEALRIHFIDSLRRAGYHLSDNSYWKDIKAAYEAFKKDCEGRTPSGSDEDLTMLFCLPIGVMREVEKILEKLVEFDEKFSTDK